MIGIDGHAPVLIYAVILKTPDNYHVDIFSIDRMDGEPLINYPNQDDKLMIMEAGIRIGGADLRCVFEETPHSPPWRLI